MMLRMVALTALAAAPMVVGAATGGIASPPAQAVAALPESSVVHYRTATVGGLDIFYREAGPKDAPTVLLLHGFPTSSFEYRNLIPALADRYHVIAPDYPGFGHSSAPDHKAFAYTFAHLTDAVEGLLQQIGVSRYALYIQDYGAPVGLRLALRHPERVTALVVQNGNAYREGIQDFWKPVETLWADPTQANRDAVRKVLTPEFTRWQYLNGVKDPTRVDPDTWQHDQVLLDRPGNDEIQLDLFYDYRTNVAMYPEFENFFRTRKPPTLIVWGANDVIFPAAGAEAYLRDNPGAELHLLDTGHFALEDRLNEIVPLMRDFLARALPHH